MAVGSAVHAGDWDGPLVAWEFLPTVFWADHDDIVDAWAMCECGDGMGEDWGIGEWPEEFIHAHAGALTRSDDDGRRGCGRKWCVHGHEHEGQTSKLPQERRRNFWGRGLLEEAGRGG